MAERTLLQAYRQASAGVVLLALAGCAGTKQDAKIVGEYVAHHPDLTPDQRSRLQFRNAVAGDTLELLQMIFIGCQLEQTSEDGFYSVYKLTVPADGQKIRLGTASSPEEIFAGGEVMLTFDHKKLARWTIIDSGMHLP
jgi:hypothetical protein